MNRAATFQQLSLCLVLLASPGCGKVEPEPVAPPFFAFHAGPAVVGYIGLSGRFLIEPRWLVANDFSEGFATVCDPGSSLWGILNEKGDLVGSCDYDDVGREGFREGKLAVKVSHKWGFIDKNNHWIIKPQYLTAGAFSEGLALVRTDSGLWGYLDSNNKMKISPAYDFASPFTEGVASVSLNGENWLIDKEGTALFNHRFRSIDWFSEGLAPAQDESGQWKYIDRKGDKQFGSYAAAAPFKGGLAAVKEGSHWGFVDHSGKVAIPLRYEWVGAFSDGLAPFKRNGERGFMDKAGNTAVKLDGDAEILSGFENGLAYVRGKHEEYYVDKNGVCVARRGLVGTR